MAKKNKIIRLTKRKIDYISVSTVKRVWTRAFQKKMPQSFGLWNDNSYIGSSTKSRWSSSPSAGQKHISQRRMKGSCYRPLRPWLGY